eukprot:5965675-Pyramimonas_sp.AAC.1
MRTWRGSAGGFGRGGAVRLPAAAHSPGVLQPRPEGRGSRPRARQAARRRGRPWRCRRPRT